MKRVIYFRVAGSDVHLPRLIGSFILFAALLMFIHSAAAMFDSWDHMKAYDRCIQGINTDQSIQDQRLEFNACSDPLYKATGVVVREDSAGLTLRQFWSALLAPLATILFWLAVLLIGYFLYRTGNLSVPIIEETISSNRFSFKGKKKGR